MASLQPLRPCAAWAVVIAFFTGVAAVRESIDDSQLAQDIAVGKRAAGSPGEKWRAAEQYFKRELEARAKRNKKKKEEKLEKEREQLMKEMKKEEERTQKERQHILENRKDCEWTEKWSEFGECSATCGGGLSTKRLLERRVTQPQDEFNYGRPCPDICAGSDCTEEVSEPCSYEPCPSDCSVVDFGNVLPSTGTALAWQGGGLGCVYQFWHVEGKALKLLAETDPQTVGAESILYELDRFGDMSELMFLKPDDERRVVLGFRSCREPVALASPSGPTPNIAKVCLWGDSGFEEHSQNRELSSGEREALQEQRESGLYGRAPRSQSLFHKGRRGVSDSTPGVTFEGDPQEATTAGYALRVIMADEIPHSPRLDKAEVDEVTFGLRLKFFDRGDGEVWQGRHVFARRVFTSSKTLEWDWDNCESQLVPKCQEGQEVPCLEEDLTLRHFVPGSSMLVEVNCENAAGHVRNTAETLIKFGVKVGRPWDLCPVDKWATKEQDEVEYAEVNPGVPQCRLDTPPVLPCRTKEKKDLFGNLKCIGKRYWQTFWPQRDDGKPYFYVRDAVTLQPKKRNLTACAKTLQGICTHEPKLKGEETVRKCDTPGCGSGMFSWQDKTCCCYPGKAGEEDCACTSEKCESLGLVEAADPKKSCRH